MQLILWRHAQAHIGDDDLARCLTEKGHQQAMQMGAKLQMMLPENVQLWVSQAKRSSQTADYLKIPQQCFAILNPESDVVDIVDFLLGKLSGNEIVIIVGHQPWLGQLCAFLLNQEHVENNDWSIKKAAFWWFSVRIEQDCFVAKLKMMQQVL